MYRLILVDDKPSVLAGLRQLGRWEDLGVTLAGEAQDGAAALELAGRVEPHIVLTDIRMPVMDGLELARRLTEQRPAPKIILLTGYDDFEYARTALRLGAVEFLTKPSTVDEIRAAVGRAVALLDQERERALEMESLREQLQESLPLLRQEYLGRLLRGELPPGDLPRLFALAGIALQPEQALTVVCFGLDAVASAGSDPAETELHRLVLARSIASTMPSWIVIRGRDGQLVAIGHGASNVAGVLEAMAMRGISVSAGISRPTALVLDLPRAHEEAYTALQQRFFLEPGAVIHIDDVCPGGFGPVSYPAWAEEQILLALRAGAEEQASEGLAAFFRQATAGADRARCGLMLAELAFSASRVLRELGVAQAPPDLTALPSIGACQEQLEQWLGTGARAVRAARQDRQADMVSSLREYILSHLSGDCSLQALAEQAHLSPTYLAQLFKRQTGQTLLEYVTAIKMEQAKVRLATTDQKVASICDDLGYGDRRHFAELFRRCTGMTPTEYRERYHE
ncbi:MAG TPA: response regulator [Symbiobacteriaceae bacterium]|nr:response regulator [Symbiobacteriaceae bacterium]